MRIVCIGGGPGGLYAAILLKKADPGREVTVIEKNPRDTTYGWGVVFSDETLGFLEDADPETYALIAESFVRWDAIDIHYRGETIRSGGHAFSGLARARLLHILENRATELGVQVVHDRTIEEIAEFAGADLVVAADGVHSAIRNAHGDVFRPSFDVHPTKYIWLGVPMRFEAFTFDFRETPFGIFQAHAYPFDAAMSTFIVECNEPAWRRAGLDAASEAESLQFCASLFKETLGGRQLFSNRSTWINFVTLRNENWRYGNLVLLGDAAHTAHFSIGSGTKLAMEDAIALAHVLDMNDNVRAALVDYEALRQPVVERTQLAARDSSLWFEHTQRHARFEPTQFAFSLLTRSKRITYENLQLRDPRFARNVDAWFQRQSDVSAAGEREPLRVPLRLNSVSLPNRVVALRDASDAEDGHPGAEYGATLASQPGSSGLVVAANVAIASDGRISPASPGMYSAAHVPAWASIVDTIHAGGAAAGIQLSHAGARGAMRPRTEGTDLPLPDGGWPLVAASPLPYTSGSATPRELTVDEMESTCEAFAASACMSAAAGFDLLDLQFGHGYLLASFISPLSNRRDDDYGGNLDNRLRFPLAVLQRVRAAWPREHALSVCFSAADWQRGGLPMTEAIEIARQFRDGGADLIHVVSGGTTPTANPPYGRAWQAALGDVIRNEARVPVVLGGNLTSADELNTILAAGRADLCVLSPLATLSPANVRPATARPAP